MWLRAGGLSRRRPHEIIVVVVDVVGVFNDGLDLYWQRVSDSDCDVDLGVGVSVGVSVGVGVYVYYHSP